MPENQSALPSQQELERWRREGIVKEIDGEDYDDLVARIERGEVVRAEAFARLLAETERAARLRRRLQEDIAACLESAERNRKTLADLEAKGLTEGAFYEDTQRAVENCGSEALMLESILREARRE